MLNHGRCRRRRWQFSKLKLFCMKAGLCFGCASMYQIKHEIWPGKVETRESGLFIIITPNVLGEAHRRDYADDKWNDMEKRREPEKKKGWRWHGDELLLVLWWLTSSLSTIFSTLGSLELTPSTKHFPANRWNLFQSVFFFAQLHTKASTNF